MRKQIFTGVALAATGAGALAAYVLAVRPWHIRWGATDEEVSEALPGDELVLHPNSEATHAITIDAPVEVVWPWLVQIGQDKGGFYSYAWLENLVGCQLHNADRILPEFQHIAEGTIMPTHPGGGFRIEVVEPEKALVLFIDTELVQEQARKAEAEGKTDLPTPGLKATGALGKTAFPDFAASWAFDLRPTDDGKTRLIERFRAQTPGNGPATAVLGEIMGTGIVLMTRKQMLGIKERVEGGIPEIVEDVETVSEGIRRPVEEPVGA